jgi:hypothetical protein
MQLEAFRRVRQVSMENMVRLTMEIYLGLGCPIGMTIIVNRSQGRPGVIVL